MKKYIGNVGVLDIRTATKENIDNVAGVGNVGTLIYSEQTKPFVTTLSCSNVGMMFEVAVDAKLVNGEIKITHEMLANTESPLSYLVNGKVGIEDDVTPDDVTRGLGKLWVNGLVICPKACEALVRDRCEMMNGVIIPREKGVIVVTTSLEVDSEMLERQEAPIRFVVANSLKILDDIDDALFEKIDSVKVYNKIKLRKRYADILGARLDVMGKMIVIPDDATLLDDDIELDAAALQRYDSARLWTSDRIRFLHDVTPDMLKKHIKSIKCDDMIICRSELRPALLELCENEANMIAYDNDLVIIDGSQSISAAELKFRQGTFALLVAGKLTIEEDVDAQMLYDRLEFAINNGKIICHGDMCGALRAKMRDNKGKVVDTSQPAEKKPEGEKKEYLVENAGIYKL